MKKKCDHCSRCTCDDFLKTVIAFGRHKGETLKTIGEEDPGYIVWLYDNEVRGFHEIISDEFYDDCLEAAEDRGGPGDDDWMWK